MKASEIHTNLTALLKAHALRAKEPYSGPYHLKAVNDAIGNANKRANRLIKENNLWPAGKRVIGNAERLRILESAGR